MKKGGL
ncbi:uncharacterized protein FTOL_05231 [Fusarium torulosum]|nr:uncharacterized protein FTOL_05231 [Fusarium torulosum]